MASLTGLTTPGGDRLVRARDVFAVILDANTGSEALEGLERIPGQVALNEVSAELDRQDEKWGEQHHPDGTGPDVLDVLPFRVDGDEDAGTWAQVFRTACDNAAARGEVTWRHILLEEVFEAIAEPEGSDELRTELLQVAAVAVQWALAIDRRPSAEG